MYSSPPGHGAAIAAAVLSDPALFSEWERELQGMAGALTATRAPVSTAMACSNVTHARPMVHPSGAGRIKEMRTSLHASLKKAKAPGNWDHVLKQIGMFSYTGLTPKQVRCLSVPICWQPGKACKQSFSAVVAIECTAA